MAVQNSRYTAGFPTGEVRLRNWPAGKVAQLKKIVELLTTQLNLTMATQVEQGSKAVPSSRVPKVTGLSIIPGFKNFQITFDEAKGIDDLLFYEIQQDTTSSFANPTIYRIPQTTLTIPTTVEHQQIYVRVRCQNTKFEVGSWSSTQHATGSSNFRISVARQSRVSHRMDLTAMDTWETVTALTYTPAAASTFINLHMGLAVRTLADHADQTVNSNDDYNIYGSVTFRVLRNGIELTNAGTVTLATNSEYTMQNSAVNIGPIKARQERAVFGSLVLPFETFTGGEPSITYTVQAKVNSSATVLVVNLAGTLSGTVDTLGAVDVYVDCFDTVEVIQSL